MTRAQQVILALTGFAIGYAAGRAYRHWRHSPDLRIGPSRDDEAEWTEFLAHFADSL